MKKQLLIVFHSQSARTEQLAFAVRRGALMEADIKVRLLRAIDASSEDVLAADALLLLTPENFAAISGGMKQFLDRAYYPLERKSVQGLPYAILICAGNDGSSCEKQIKRIMTGLKARLIQEPYIVYGEPNLSDINASVDLGQAFAAGLVLGIY